jgi:hypothetical protein
MITKHAKVQIFYFNFIELIFKKGKDGNKII